MALLWADGFDHYGTEPSGGRDAMLSMGWAAVTGHSSVIPSVSAAQARTGQCTLLVPGGSRAIEGDRPVARRAGIAGLEGGVSCAVYQPNLGGGSEPPYLGVGLRTASAWVLRIAIEADGAILAISGNTVLGTELGRSEPVVQAGIWNHIELRYRIAGEASAVEVRHDGQTVLSLEDVDLGEAAVTILHIGTMRGGTSASISWVDTYFDDVVAWDTTGERNNDFLGPRTRVFTTFPANDTAQADWQPAGAVGSPPPAGYTMLAKEAPDDDTYLESQNPPAGSPPAGGDVSEFALPSLPDGLVSINGVHMVTRMRAGDEGTPEVRVSLVSEGQETAGQGHLLASSFGGYHDLSETNPATGAPWTQNSLGDALLRLARTG